MTRRFTKGVKRWITAALFITSAFATRAGNAYARQTPSQDYVHALAVANQFLSAWILRDVRGLDLISPSMRRKYGVIYLKQWIIGLSNPHNESFDITNGVRINDKRYSFRVHYYTHYTNYSDIGTKGPQSLLVIVKAKSGRWLVNDFSHELPLTRADRMPWDEHYEITLRCADILMGAWIGLDHAGKSALSILMTATGSDHGKGNRSKARLKSFLSQATVRHEAFEISAGRRLNGGRYEFHVRLYERRAGSKQINSRRSRIVVAKTGKGWAEWGRIIRLP